jgi:uncharacterized protein (TIGR00369 family)
VSPAIPDEVKRIFATAPFITDIGIRLESAGSGECTTVLPLERRHLQQDGYVHAGVQATIADHTAGAAAASLVKDGQSVLSAEFKINLLRAAKGERLICRAKVLKAGAQLTVVESEVFCVASGEERLVSKATVTLAVVAARAG